MTRTTTVRTALVLAALLALTGCTSTNEAGTGSPSSSVPSDGLTGELTIFAAASLQPVFDELAATFAADHPDVTVNPVTYDGSSTLATQLVEGGNADVFASADEKTMTPVVDAGLTASAPTIFTTNTLQIVVAPGNPKKVTSLADLATLADDGGIVVLCAAAVPCGSASQQVLDAAKVELKPASEEQSVSAVLTKVVSGEADAGLVYRTDVLKAGDDVEGVDFAEAAGVVNKYPIAALGDDARDDGHEVATAQAFVDLVLSAEGQQVLADKGFTAP
ncbi:molybdate ABC transporter substrate-binding protein [Cellulomonas sp. PhB150]|uniref:molybdate ABC transporter substrate-binding protein n=1 Tax=Cellulomonas sp. PhB150 TaxID=2485188 RepID=UPI000F48859E|nr:molybdate ABC transporter substrate-binding protein [Cellulomonas sp. PhB150]ROS31289.1 molybdate transport system substrate-binding protein [Cellulomonas sp. PhB150]